MLSTGYAANLAVLTTLADAGTLVVSDEHTHASLIDGCAPLLPRERLSWIAVNFSLPPGIKYSEFAPRMQAEGFFLLYGVPGNESHFQVSTIGDLTDADVEGLCRAFDRVLAPIVQTRAATEAARVHGGAS